MRNTLGACQRATAGSDVSRPCAFVCRRAKPQVACARTPATVIGVVRREAHRRAGSDPVKVTVRPGV